MATQAEAGHRSEGKGAPGGAATDAQAKAQQAAGQAQDKAQQAAGQAQDKAQAAAGQAQAKMREQLEQRSSQLGTQAHQQASDLRSVSEALRDQGRDRPAQAVDRLARYAEQVGSYLRDSDADSMLSDAEDFGRRKPGAVAAGALAVGLVASRFLKASSRRRYSARQADQHRGPAAGSTPPPSPSLPVPATSNQPTTTQAGL